MKPPIAPNVDLQDFRFMPLDVARLWDSDLSTTVSGDAFRAAVLLWCKAWHQIPAGSLPNDERTLMKFAACAPELWATIRDDAMHGFLLCDDGRFYHPVVCEKANEAWESREKYRKAANTRWKNKKKLNDASHLKRIENASKMHMQETGTGTGIEREIKKKENTKESLPSKGNGSAKATKLPKDWRPSVDDVEYASVRGFSSDQIEGRLVPDFVEHFTNGKGRKESRENWSLSWMRWVRQDIEWNGDPHSRRSGGSNGSTSSGGDPLRGVEY